MKVVATATAAEIANAIAQQVLKRPEYFGKHVAAVEMIHDPARTDASRFKIEVVMFDTEKGARDYLQPFVPEKEAA